MSNWVDISAHAPAMRLPIDRAPHRASRRFAAISFVLVLVTMLVASPRAAAAAPAPPPNDLQADAQVIHTLPATIGGTTVGATSDPGAAGSSICSASTGPSVWYSLRSPAAQRIAVNLAASGALEAAVDVFHVVRSQLNSVACDQTDVKGKAAASFNASQNGLYLIRVAALATSQLAPFTLEVFLPTPAVRPPGAQLPAGGIGGHVDSIQNVNAAYAITLRSGVSYLINLANGRGGGCVNGRLYPPGTRSFEEGTPAVVHINCRGYRLFTPGPGQGGRYSFEVTPQGRGVKQFRLQVARADSSETAPGLGLGNYAHGHGHLDGRGVHVLRLYRMDIGSHSNLTLKLKAPASADFNLQLRNIDGRVIDCSCGESGSQTLQHQLQPGRYYAVVSVRDNSSASFTLVRESRTITSTSVSFGSANATPGSAVGLQVKVSPAASGPVTVRIERFDPVFGWQFYRQARANAVGGVASVPFVAPAIGRWRANATFAGSLTFSPSAVGFSYLLVS
ncbi:MAG TPA: hypothetical protein VGH09_05675 [Solirubrobacteraceae bacterium]|jgi:hypothetical protein